MLQTTTGFGGGFAAFPGLDRSLDIRLCTHVNFGVVNDLRRMFLRQHNHAILVSQDQVARPDFHVAPDAGKRHRTVHGRVFPFPVRIDGRGVPAPDWNRPIYQRLTVANTAIQQETTGASTHHARHHVVSDDRTLVASIGRDHHDRTGRYQVIKLECGNGGLAAPFPAFCTQRDARHFRGAKRAKVRSKHLCLQPHRDQDVCNRRGFQFRKPHPQWLFRHAGSSHRIGGKLDTSPPLIYHQYIKKPVLPMAAPEQIPGTGEERTIPNVPAPICKALRELGLTHATGQLFGEPLSGGVSCDIWRVDLPEGPVCAKRALAKLKVAGEWFAPTSRIDFEAAYYRFARTVAPGVTPEVLGHDPSRGVLVTEYLPSSEYTAWKEELQNGVIRTDLVRQLALTLRRLHDASLADSQVHAAFTQPDLIHALRLSPYFLASIPANPELEHELTGLVKLFEENRHWLIHGDFSPKNILFGRDRPVILDAECANTGDAAFDLAFCSAHLCLKAAWKPQHASKYKAAFDTFHTNYFAAGTDHDLDARAARYLSGFLLARMDGKSPVEYITAPTDKAAIRNFAWNHLKQAATSLRALADEWFSDWAPHSDKGETQA